MLDKLKDWLFKEDYEDLTIEENEDDFEEEEVLKSIYDEPQIQKTESRAPFFEERKEKVVETPVAKPKVSIDIKVDDPIVEEAPKKEMETSRNRIPLPSRKEEFEMTPVISPYFGVKEEHAPHTENPKLNVISSNKKSDHFNSVISPYYGEKEMSIETYPTTTRLNRSTSPDVKQTSTSFITLDTPIVNETDEEDNLSLDEIVSNKVENDDDLIQFSLFGEAKKIHEDEFENENSENDDNVELPF